MKSTEDSLVQMMEELIRKAKNGEPLTERQQRIYDEWMAFLETRSM